MNVNMDGMMEVFFDLCLHPKPHDSDTDSFNDSNIDEDLIEAIGTIETMEDEETTPTTDDNDSGNPPPTHDDKLADDARFPSFTEDDLDQLLTSVSSKHTDKMTKWGVNLLKNCMSQRGMDPNFEILSCESLDDFLRRFYAEVRNSEGGLYSKSTFVGIRASINRHLRNPPHNRSISIMESKDFHRSNQMFIAVLKKLKKEGHDKTAHHPPISVPDLEKLRSSGILGDSNPRSLQRKVWFDITISFARRGRENFRELQYDCFEFKFDDVGKEYVQMKYNEATKNHQGDNIKDGDYQLKPRMYATETDSCPVKSLRKYLLKRNPDSNHLFQQARPGKVSEGDSVWYIKRPVGVRVLNDMMKSISNDAALSRIYTNHSVRATTITLLAHAGVETREIMKVSGHHNDASVRSYNADSSDAQKRAYSAIIHGESTTQKPQASSSATSTADPPSVSSLPADTSSRALMPLEIHNNATYNSLVQCHQRPSYVSYQGQFAVNNSTVHVHNYYSSS